MAMMMAIKRCIVCGRQFRANHGHASALSMCSAACMTAHYLRIQALERSRR